MPSIYGSTINEAPRQNDGAQAGPMRRREANPSGSGGWSGGLSNGGGYNTRGSQPSSGRTPQSAYGQSAQSYGGASYGAPSYSRGADGPTPNESQSQSRQQATASPAPVQFNTPQQRISVSGYGQSSAAQGMYAPQAVQPAAPIGYPGLSPIPSPAPLPSTTASPDQLMAARFNIPGLTPGLGLPQPPPVPVEQERRLPPVVPPPSTYGGMFAR